MNGRRRTEVLAPKTVRLLAALAGLVVVCLATMLAGRTTLAWAATATFGKTSVGASAESDPANLKGVSKYALPTAGQ